MSEIIPQIETPSNPYLSSAARSVPYLSKRCYQILKILAEDFDSLPAGTSSQRPRAWYALRFRVSERMIKYDFAYLRDLGLCTSSPGGKGQVEKRWITSEGYYYSVNQASPYISPYNSDIPYIDLLESGERSLQILKDEQICEQNPNEPPPDIPSIARELEKTLNTALDASKISFQERSTLKHAVYRSQITIGAKLDFVNRMAWGMTKNSVKHKRAYFLKAIQNEEQNARQRMHI